MSATKQLTQTNSQVWGAKQNLIMPEPQFLPESMEPISDMFIVTESLSIAPVVQRQSSSISTVQGIDFFQTANITIGTFMSGMAKEFVRTKKLDRDTVSPSVYCVTLDRIVVDGKTLRLHERCLQRQHVFLSKRESRHSLYVSWTGRLHQRLPRRNLVRLERVWSRR